MARLGDVCKLVSGTSLPETIVTDNGELPYVKVAELNMPENIPNITTSRQFVSVTNISAKQIIPVGTIIFPKRGGAIGTNKKRLVSTPICMDLNLMGVIPSSKLYPQYLYYFFENIDMGSLSNGSSVPQINNSDIAPLEIRIPDISTQKDIATHLDKVGKLIALRKEQLAKLDQLVKSRFIELFGDPVTNSMGWNTDTVNNLCQDIYGGGTPSKAHPEYYENGDIPWVSSKDMKTDILYDSQIKINQLGVDNSTAKMVPVNSVIMVIRSGILKHTLPVAINAVPITVNQDLKVFVPSYKISPVFLLFLFKMLEKDILTGVRAVTADNIEFNTLKERLVIVPPIALQEQFAAFVEQTEKSKLAIHQSLDKLELLKKSLMQEYFG